jgi:Fe-S cluster biogenesis protein NfuA
VALVRCALVAGRMARREELRALADSWLQRELPHVPPGNAPGAEGAPGSEWGAHDSAAELQGGARAAYEEQRLKMRKAMGENLHDVPRDESDSERERREKLLRAVEGDNWSAVVGQQTVQASSRDEADDGADDGATQRLQRQAMVSPFAREGVQQTAAGASIDVATGAVAAPVLTVAAAHECLDEMRPYLIADGGDVEVVGVEDGVVALRLTGACGTCPSSATTMSMGLEKALRKTFGEQIAQVAQVDAAGAPTGPGGGGPPTVTRASVEEHLATLRPTLKKYGGRVKVARVEGDRVEVEFEGAEPLFMGIEAALKNKFPTLAEVARVPEE